MSIMLTLSNKGAMLVVDCKPLDKSMYFKINFCISEPKQMLWVLIETYFACYFFVSADFFF